MTKGFWHIEEVRDEIANAHPTGEWVEGEDVASTVGWLLNPPNHHGHRCTCRQRHDGPECTRLEHRQTEFAR